MEMKELRTILRAMGDVARLRMLQVLAGRGQVTVSELTHSLRISQPLASWHLRILRKAGLVTTHRDGRQVYCTLNRARIEECCRSLQELLQPAPGERRSGFNKEELNAQPGQNRRIAGHKLYFFKEEC